MRYILYIVVIVLLVSGCSNSTGNIVKDGEFKSKNITIQIDDNHITEQHYLIDIMTNGKETKNIAVFPQLKYVITNNKKQVKVEVVEDVPYIIKVHKTNAKSVKELFNKPKIVESSSQVEEPLAEVKFTPSTDLNNLKIKVNPNL